MICNDKETSFVLVGDFVVNIYAFGDSGYDKAECLDRGTLMMDGTMFIVLQRLNRNENLGKEFVITC